MSSQTEGIQKSAKMVDTSLTRDRIFVPSEMVDPSPPLGAEDVFRLKQSVVLPDPLFEQYEKLEYKCFMGLFPQIHRAWVTIDNKFLIWSYLNGSDFNEYDELDQVIVSVGLVRPKPGIFKDQVHYLLVLATPVEVVLVAVSFVNGELHLEPTNYSVPSDSVNMLKIAGSWNGRIFMCGQNGCLYELTYEASEGWLREKCRKVNHSQSVVGVLVPSFLKFSAESPLIDIAIDDERNILYTLSDNSTIDVYDLGVDGNSIIRVATYSTLAKDAKRKTPRFNWDPKDLRLVSIAPIKETESKQIHLVAISSKGERFFFSTNPAGISQYSRPNQLFLHTIRPFATPALGSAASRVTRTSAGQNAVNDVHECFYNKGVFIMADSKGEDLDDLICVSTERRIRTVYSAEPTLTEISTSKKVYAKSHAIAEVPLYIDAILVPDADYMNELATQHVRPPREFVCLCNNGIHLLTKLRPVDRLQQILQSSANSNQAAEQEIREFFKSYGDDEACSMCVIIACNPSALFGVVPQNNSMIRNIADLNIAELATDVFFKLGGEPRFQEARSVFGGVQEMGGPISSPDISYSASHNGLYLYFSRLIYPLWNNPVLNARLNEKGEIADVIRRYDREQLEALKQSLLGLADFLQKHPALHSAHESMAPQKKIRHRLFGEYSREDRSMHGGLTHMRDAEEAQKIQQRSIAGLFEIVKRSVEGVSFLQFLVQFGMSSYLKEIPQEELRYICRLAFRDMILAPEGEVVMKDLIRLAVVRTDDVERIIHDLRSYSIFFNPNDIREYRALNKIRLVQSQDFDRQRREQLLNDALQDYLQIAGHINVPEICKDFQRMQYYTGAVDLALAGAEQIDPSHLALNWVKNGKPQHDVQAAQLYRQRMEYYKCALSVLEELTSQPGPQVATGLQTEVRRRVEIQSSEDRRRLRQQVLNKMQQSKDVLFHYTLYNWYLSKGNLTQELLSFKTPYLEQFLINESHKYLLYQYYAANEKYDKAANILMLLAEAPNENISLDSRIEYLSMAIGSAKAGLGMGELLHTLQDKLEVARVQKKIYEELAIQTNIPEETKRRMLIELNSRLSNISDLYNKYANPFGLLESCLLTLAVAGYKDEALVQKLWLMIIDRNDIGPLERKIRELGKEIHMSPFFFPMDLICAALEKKNNAINDWVVRIMKSLTTTPLYSEIYNAYRSIYNKVLHSKDSEDTFSLRPSQDIISQLLPNNERTRLMLLYNLSLILAEWVNFVKGPSASVADFKTFPADVIYRHIIEEYEPALNVFRVAEAEKAKKNLKRALDALVR